MAERYIFLDIDGVLNSVDSAIAFYKNPQSVMAGEHRHGENSLDRVCIGLLRRLCTETGARVVISSTWRMGRSRQDFMDIFSAYGWPDFPCVGMTPVRPGCRGDEIKEWLAVHARTEDQYIILDDDSDMRDEQLPRFIHCSNLNGFRGKHFVQALRLFGRPDDRLEQQYGFVRKTDKGEVHVESSIL